MMDLRKCTNHPYLIEFPLSEDGQFYQIGDDIVESCGKMKVFEQLLTALIERKHKILVFSQMTRMLNILEFYLEKQVRSQVKFAVFHLPYFIILPSRILTTADLMGAWAIWIDKKILICSTRTSHFASFYSPPGKD